MAHFYQSAFLEALGWSLVDSFWKMGCMWFAYLAVTANGTWFTALGRYRLALLLMAAGSIWSFFGIVGYYQDIMEGKPISPSSVLFRHYLINLVSEGWVMTSVSMMYLSAVVFLTGRLLYRYIAGRKSIAVDLLPPDRSMVRVLEELVQRINIKRSPRLFLSRVTQTPVTLGFLKPIILLPITTLTQLTIDETEAILAHELIHIRRNDYLLNLLVEFSGALLFFNPFALRFKSILRHERELICDDEVLALGFDRWKYANALYTVAKQGSNTHMFALAAGGHRPFLLQRVSRILQVNGSATSGGFAGALLKSMVIVSLCLLIPVLVRKSHKEPSVSRNENVVKGPGVQALQPVSLRSLAVVPEKKRVESTIPGKTAKRKMARREGEKDLVILPPAAPPLPIPLPPDAIISYVSDVAREHSFTLIVPEPPRPPQLKLVLDGTVPYVPSSTFYFSIPADSLTAEGKKTVHL